MQLNTIIEARPSKIVAGLEPENTNRSVGIGRSGCAVPE
jgi:hypothetical protein